VVAGALLPPAERRLAALYALVRAVEAAAVARAPASWRAGKRAPTAAAVAVAALAGAALALQRTPARAPPRWRVIVVAGASSASGKYTYGSVRLTAARGPRRPGVPDAAAVAAAWLLPAAVASVAWPAAVEWAAGGRPSARLAAYRGARTAAATAAGACLAAGVARVLARKPSRARVAAVGAVAALALPLERRHWQREVAAAAAALALAGATPGAGAGGDTALLVACVAWLASGRGAPAPLVAASLAAAAGPATAAAASAPDWSLAREDVLGQGASPASSSFEDLGAESGGSGERARAGAG